MPLTWDATDCDLDYEDDNEAVITQTIVFMSAAIGMGTITKKNWKEFYIRSEIMNKLKGPFMFKGGEGYALTPGDIYRRIGLRTNVTFTTKAAWRKNVMEDLERDAKWRARDVTQQLDDGNL